MSKQEEIREGAIVSLMKYKGFDRGPCEYIVDHLAKYYDSQGVVIKVERELPENPIPIPNLKGSVGLPQQLAAVSFQTYRESQQDMLEAGYTAVEPLLEE